MNAILLSAGFGTRFRPYTNTYAKPAIPFLNLPLIAYSMFYANKWSCEDIIINTHHLPESIKSCVSNLKHSIDCNVNFLNEAPEILDSGGGIKNAENYLDKDDSFLVFNTDIPHVFPKINFDKIKKQHDESNSLVTFVTCDIEGLGIKVPGIWSEQNSNKIVDAGLGPKENLICRHYSGVMLISQKLFDLQPPNKPHNIIYDVILPAIHDGHKASCYHIDSLKWFETGRLDSYLDASFDVIDELIDNPSSPYSFELNNIFKKYNLTNYISKNENYRLLYNNSLSPDLDLSKLSGSVILGEGIELKKINSLSNSVIYSNLDIGNHSYNRELIL